MSGYSIKITAFLPCGKDNAAHTFAGGCLAEIREVLELVGCQEIDLRDEFKPNRKSVPAPASPNSQAQEPAGSDTPESAMVADLSLPAGNDMPAIPRHLDRRVPREPDDTDGVSFP